MEHANRSSHCRWWQLALLAMVGSGCDKIVGLDKDFVEVKGDASTREQCAPSNMVAAPTSCGDRMRGLPGGYCIDQYEVSWGEYRAWLATNPSVSGQDSVCADNDDFKANDCQPDVLCSDTFPVAYVDWCDALAYCRAHDKHLCGAIDGGGELPAADADSCSKSEWYNACSSGGLYIYCAGDSPPAACNIPGSAGVPQPEATTVGCQSWSTDYKSIYSMSGNVAEWVNTCDPNSKACQIRGGSFNANSGSAECAGGQLLDRTSRLGFVGFRCCK